MPLNDTGSYDYIYDETLNKYIKDTSKINTSPQIAYNSDLCMGSPGNQTPDAQGRYDDLQYKYYAPAPRDMQQSGTQYVRTAAQNEEIRIRKFIKLSQDNDIILKKTVKKVDVEYYLSTSSSTTTGGSWSTTAPAWVDGKYMWSRQKVTFVDNTTSTTNTTCIAGAKGSTGATGTSVDSITEEYYLSTSKTTQTGGSWVTTPPSWSSGKYIWTRSKIVYKNPASTEYTEPICSSEWEAVNEINVGGRNYFLKSEDFTNSTTNGAPSTTIIEQLTESDLFIPENFKGKEVTLSFDYESNGITGSSGRYGIELAFRKEDNTTQYCGKWISESSGDQKGRASLTFTIPDTWTGVLIENHSYIQNIAAGATIKITKPKIEIGNKPTDWTPAPEDIDDALNNKVDLSAYESKVNNIDEDLTYTQQTIDAVNRLIRSLATDASGSGTYYNQDSTGFTFTLGDIYNALASKVESDQFSQEQLSTSELFGRVNSSINSLSNKTSQIQITQENGLPVMILGSSNSDFKIKITNESIDFLYKSIILAFANYEIFNSDIMRINRELQHITKITYQYASSDTNEIPSSGWQNTHPKDISGSGWPDSFDGKYFWTKTIYNGFFWRGRSNGNLTLSPFKNEKYSSELIEIEEGGE